MDDDLGDDTGNDTGNDTGDDTADGATRTRDAPDGRFRVVGHGPPAVAALRNTIAAVKAADPLAPVSVAPPSAYAGLSLRRRLAREVGLVNVRFLPLVRIAELLGAPRLALQGRRPLVPAVEGAVARAALRAEPGVLADVAHHRATRRSLVSTFADLRELPDPALDRLAETGPRAATLVRLFREARARSAGFYDHNDLIASAAAAASDHHAPAFDDVGHVVLYLPRQIGPTEARLLEVLAERQRLSVVLAQTGDPRADAAVASLVSRVSSFLGPPTVERHRVDPPRATAAVVAPDPSEEVRSVLRDVSTRLEGEPPTPLHRIAVLYADREPYARLLHDACTTAEIPHHSVPVGTLAETVAGRSLLGLLDLAASDFQRNTVIDWLSCGPLLETAGGEPTPTGDWDRLTRIGGIVRGVAQWRRRLGGLDARLRADERDLSATPDLPDAGSRLERITRDRELVGRLVTFVDDLDRRLRRAPSGSWSDLCAWAIGLLVRYLGTERQRESWPDDEAEAFLAVTEAVGSVSPLDVLEPDPDLGTFNEAVVDLLDAPAGRIGRFGDGLFLAPLAAAEGGDFDVVYVVGMTEGAFPRRRTDDPLIPDRERRAAGAPMPLSAERQAEDRRRYLAALASAPERILLAPRSDPRAQQERMPARWFIDAASELDGRRLTIPEVDEWGEEPNRRLRRVPSAESGLLNATTPASVGEHDLTVLTRYARSVDSVRGHPLVAVRPDLAAGFDAIDARVTGAPGPWTGFTGPVDGVVTRADHPLSPTSLQHWATCPFRYYLRSVLRVAERDDPAEIEDLTALDRGSIMHEILERLVGENLDLDPDQPWDPVRRARAREIADEVFEDYEERGRTGHELMWRHRRAHLLAELDRALDADERRRREERLRPVAVELPFGVRDTEPLRIRLSDDREVAMRGSADRVDRAPGGIVVHDYKTGSPRSYTKLPDDPVDRGRHLQLPVYALAARERYGDVPVAAYYWFVSDRGDYRPIGYELTDGRLHRFLGVIETIVDGIEHGRFPARPGNDSWDPFRRRDTYDNCRYCDFDRVCGADRADTWAALRGTAELAAYVELAEGDPVRAEAPTDNTSHDTNSEPGSNGS